VAGEDEKAIAALPQELPQSEIALPQIESLIAAVIQEKETNDANELSTTGWRIEVTHRGRYYFWRRGWGERRESRTGGKFAALPQERQSDYRKNAAVYQRRNRNRRALADTPASD
jgi:hypothetical protein